MQLLVLLLCPLLCLAAVFDLSALDWTLVNQNGSIAVPASIPSHVHLDLARAGLITEPLLGINGTSRRTY
jgi:beta-mannosidase